MNAVTALKTLGRSQGGTEDLASEEVCSSFTTLQPSV